MNDVAFLILSCEGREDILPMWYKAKDHFWPQCPIQKEYLLTGTNEHGWTHQLERLLQTVEEKWVVLMGDDGCFASPVKEDLFRKIFALIDRDPKIATCHIRGAMSGLTSSPLKGYGYLSSDLLHKATCPDTSFWRTDVLLEMARFIKTLIKSPAQDHGWTGFYNFELHSWKYLANNGLRCLAPFDYGFNPWSQMHVVAQGKWQPWTEGFWAEIGFDPVADIGDRGFYTGDNWCSKEWNDASPMRFK